MKNVHVLEIQMDLLVSPKYRAFTCFLRGRECSFFNVKIINRLDQQEDKFYFDDDLKAG